MSATASLSVEGVTKRPMALSNMHLLQPLNGTEHACSPPGVIWSDDSVTNETDVSYIITSGEEYVYNYQVEEGILRGNNSTSTARSVTIRGTFSYGGTVLTDHTSVTINGKEVVTASDIVLYE